MAYDGIPAGVYPHENGGGNDRKRGNLIFEMTSDGVVSFALSVAAARGIRIGVRVRAGVFRRQRQDRVC